MISLIATWITGFVSILVIVAILFMIAMFYHEISGVVSAQAKKAIVPLVVAILLIMSIIAFISVPFEFGLFVLEGLK